LLDRIRLRSTKEEKLLGRFVADYWVNIHKMKSLSLLMSGQAWVLIQRMLQGLLEFLGRQNNGPSQGQRLPSGNLAWQRNLETAVYPGFH
jgi:hypothetical protein